MGAHLDYFHKADRRRRRCGVSTKRQNADSQQCHYYTRAPTSRDVCSKVIHWIDMQHKLHNRAKHPNKLVQVVVRHFRHTSQPHSGAWSTSRQRITRRTKAITL